MKILINSIVSVRVYDTYKTFSWEEITFRPEKRLFGLVTRKAGWYDCTGDNLGMEYPKEWVKVSYPKDGVGYYYPHVQIRTSDKSYHYKFFPTLQEAQDFADHIDIQVDKRTIEI